MISVLPAARPIFEAIKTQFLAQLQEGNATRSFPFQIVKRFRQRDISPERGERSEEKCIVEVGAQVCAEASGAPHRDLPLTFVGGNVVEARVAGEQLR